MRVLLNVDAGESDEEPDDLYRLAHVVNVACGGHAGSTASMRRVVGVCRLAGTRVGAHPSYPDRTGFGRRSVAIDDLALARSVEEQCAELAAVAEEQGLHVTWVKPHGALYHDMQKSPHLAEVVLTAASRGLGLGAARVKAEGRDAAAAACSPSQVTIVGPTVGATRDAALGMGFSYAREAFADRGVRANGSLVPRGEPGAILSDPDVVRARARALARSGDCETICVHGDSPDALALVRAVREAITS